MKIRLNNPEDVNAFVSTCDSFGEFGVDVSCGAMSCDGRSSVGVLNFMGKDINVIIHADDSSAHDFESAIEKFEVD